VLITIEPGRLLREADDVSQDGALNKFANGVMLAHPVLKHLLGQGRPAPYTHSHSRIRHSARTPI
jgi:hypothetical protein